MDNNSKPTTSTRESRNSQTTGNDYLKGGAQSTLDEFQNTYENLKDKSTELYEESKDTVVNFIQTKPLTAVLVAAGVGFVLSLLRNIPRD